MRRSGVTIIARLAIAVMLLTVLRPSPARADDRIAALGTTLAKSSNEKDRLAAAAALARLGDKRAMKPLVTALADPSAKIRAVAAVGLGKLLHKAALPALKTVASEDADIDVRNHARDSARAIAKANQLPDPFAAEPTSATTPPATTNNALATTEPRRKARAGFGNSPRAIEPHPDLYVVIKSANDDSPGRADKKTRKVHADIVRETLAAQCRSAPNVTSVAADAQRWGLDLRNIDLSVVKMDVLQNGQFVEVEAQLRLAISDDKGKMLSFLSGGAKVQVPKRTFDARYLPNLRREALENAVRGLFDKLLAHLRDRSTS